MTNITSRDITDQIKRLNFNPSEIHRVILQGIRENTEGAVTIFNPSNPMMQAIEPGILTPVAVLQEIKSITRAMYAPAADTWQELNLHMTDEDLNDLVSQPSGCTVTFFLSVAEINQKAIPLNGNEDVRVIEIPRHTQIRVGEYTLMLKFPFVIQVNRFGSISVKYDLSGEAILGRVRNALISHQFVRYNDIDAVSFPVEIVQVALSSQILPISPSSGFKQKIKLTDKLFKIKAYTRFSRDQAWIEIDTTRRMRVLNRNKATLQYVESNDQLIIQVPSFYTVNGMMGNDIRLDIYTTKGALEHPLVNYNEAAYKLDYFDPNNSNNQYAGILGSFSILKMYSADVLTGGRAGLDFNTMKDRVINRSTISEGLPITELELTNRLSDLGMSSTKVIDNVTDRIYAASRLVPPPTTNLTVTGIGCNVQTHQTTVTELAALSTVRDNGNRLTVLPNTLYNMVNGVLRVVDNNLVSTMIDPDVTSPETLSTWANQNELVFSPYFYVHDTANNEYEVRPYRLDSPDILGKVTVNENPTLQLSAGVFNYQIVANSDLSGYTLYLGIAVGKEFKEIPLSDISLQISYTDTSGENRYYINGELHTPIDVNTGRPVNDQYIYRFDFKTNWDINKEHQLIMSDSFLPVPLESEMDVFIIVKGYRPTGFTGTAMDNIINIYSLANYDGQSPQSALIQERLTVKLGAFMSNIWRRARSTISAADFKRYEENIPLLYDDDVFKLDANDVPETWYNPDTHKIEPIYLHRKGDPVFKADGTPEYKHRIGDIVMENGQPVYKEGLRGLARQFDIVVMDGLYYLTTHEATLAYVKSVLDTIDEWVFDILRDKITPELLERTSVLYHPKSTVGLIEVYVENGIKTLVKSDQEFFLRIFVGDSVYTNIDLRRSMEYTSKKVLQDVLETRSTISVTDLTKTISDNLGTNALGIELKGFMGDEYNTITVIDALTTPSIGKRLSVNSKLELVVEDNVEIEFVWHSKRES